LHAALLAAQVPVEAHAGLEQAVAVQRDGVAQAEATGVAGDVVPATPPATMASATSLLAKGVVGTPCWSMRRPTTTFTAGLSLKLSCRNRPVLV